MLRLLSGRTHRVITAVTIASPAGSIRRARAVTRVTFRRLSRIEIGRYVDSGDPADKAGAYGIQNAAALFVTKIHGSWTNVVGLPMEIVHRLLGPPLSARRFRR
jgi:septum formation protein